MRGKVAIAATVWAIGAGACLAEGTPNIDHGAAVFEERCVECHIAQGGGQGPSLVGLIGRKAASAPGVLYSKALKASNIVWSKDKLDQFLSGPSLMVPGTAMPRAVPSPRDRADLVAFLASAENHR